MTDTAAREPRWAFGALLAVAMGGLVLRLVPLLGAGGPLAAPTGYDDGVYYSASALLFDGVLPYRDFVFVHPPGVLYFYGLAWSFAAARVLATIVGAVNIFLAGRIAMRVAGPFGGLVAAVLYATYPEAVNAERTAYLEPVLNLACLAMAFTWLSPRRRPVLSGVLLGAACTVKILGGIWFLAALASVPRGRFRSDALKFIASGAVTGMLLLAPLALTNLPGFVKQTLFFHSARPPDGMLQPLERLRAMFDSGHLAASVLALVAIIGMLVFVRRITREERFFGVAALLTIAAFLASSSYWVEYNAHLAASQCVLAGLVGASLRRLPGVASRALTVVVVLFIAFVQVPSLRRVIDGWRARAPEQLAVGNSIRANVPADQCVFAFDPTWTLAGGRLPPHGDGAPVVADTYGAMLLDAIDDRAQFADTGQAFQREGAQRDVRARLEKCRYAILGWRGAWQLNAANRDWFRANFNCFDRSAGELCIWQRIPPHTGLARVAQGQAAEFGDGWYGEEGGPPNQRRWMSARSVTSLPPIRGLGWLHLSFYVPSEGAEATITITLDGRVLDRITSVTGDVVRGYDVAADGDGPHSLVITTDRTFVPARSGNSTDTRELGLQLHRLIWLPRADAASMWSTR